MSKMNFQNHKDFLDNFQLTKAQNYNFAFDFLDSHPNPNKLAMLHIDDAGQAENYNYAWFIEQSARLASSIQKLGIKKGDRVMLVLFRRVEFWVTMLALQKIGAVAIPAPSQLTSKDLLYRFDKAKVKLFISELNLCLEAEEIKSKSQYLENIICLPEKNTKCLNPLFLDYYDLIASGSNLFPRPHDCACGEDPLLIFFSSGTTGMPKMVEHNHYYPLGHYVTACYWHDLDEHDIHLTIADTGWGKAIWGKFYGQMMVGATILVWDYRGKFVPKNLLEIMSKHGLTSFCAPPTIYRFMVQEDITKYDLSSLRHATTAGEALNTSVFEEWKKHTGLNIREGYGQTETCLQVATLPFMRQKTDSLGKPMPYWDIVLLKANGEVCAAGEEGEMCIRLDKARPIGLFTKYVDEPELTKEAFRNGVYHTGDKAWQDEEGFIWFLGRVDDLIKSSGYRIGPFEVESALIAHDAVVEAAVTALPDPIRGQIVKATVVLAKGYVATEALTKELQNFVKTQTAPYKYPRIIEYVDELPKTISGKIKRAEIRKKDGV